MAKTLEQIEAGDRVWVKVGSYGRRLRRVERLTARQIILDGRPEYSRFHRGKPSRGGGAPSYYQIGRGMSVERILDVATPEEVEQWDAEQRREADKAEAQRLEREAREARHAELNALFTSRRTYVHATSDERGEWHLNVIGSEEDIRRAAEVLRGVIK